MPRKKESNHSSHSAKDLIRMGVRTERLEEIHVENVLREGDLIDDRRVDVLKTDIENGDRGQITPVTLRARLEKGKIVYDVIDGFHRAEAIRLINKSGDKPILLKATVLYGCDDEEMYDRRVIAADNVKSIKFARMAKWMTASFKSRKWQSPTITADVKSGYLTLSQVFSLAMEDGSGRNLGYMDKEASELKNWALDKAKKWGRTVGSIMLDMRTIEEAAPDLVRRVRLDFGAHEGRGSLTQARLKAIVDVIPGMYELQRIFADLAVKRNIVAKDLGDLVFAYSVALEAGDKDSMRELLANPDAFLNPKPRKDTVDTQTIFDASSMTATKGAPILVRKPEAHYKPISLSANHDHAAAAVGNLLISMIEQRAFTLALEIPGEEAVTFNIVNSSLVNGNKRISLTIPESRMLLVVFALHTHSRHRITGKSLIRWFFPSNMKISENNWEQIYTMLKNKLERLSAKLANNLRITNKESLIWEQPSSKSP